MGLEQEIIRGHFQILTTPSNFFLSALITGLGEGGSAAYDQIVMSISPSGLYSRGRWVINIAFLTSSEMPFFSFRLQKSWECEDVADKTICRASSARSNEHGPLPLNSLVENLTSKQTPFFSAVDVVMWSVCLVCKKPGTIDRL